MNHLQYDHIQQIVVSLEQLDKLKTPRASENRVEKSITVNFRNDS